MCNQMNNNKYCNEAMKEMLFALRTTAVVWDNQIIIHEDYVSKIR